MSGASLSAASTLSLNETFLWQRLQGNSAGKGIGFFKLALPSGGWLYILSMNHSIKMVPFVRKKEEYFETTVKREYAAHKYRVIINGPAYEHTLLGWVDRTLGSDPIPANQTTQNGRIIHNKKIIGGNKSNMYYIANCPGDKHTVKYQFGRGYAPTDAVAAMGNMGPLIMNGMPFGLFNTYNPPQPGAVKSDQPKPVHQHFLTQRSNERFKDMANKPDFTGKIAIGYRFDKRLLFIFLQPDRTQGTSIAGLKGIALHLGLTSAVYLDGSDSVMLMLDGNFIFRQGQNKNEGTVTGVGFKY